MIYYIKKTIKINKDELFVFPLITAGIFAFGHLILWLVMIFDNSEDLTSFEMGTVMALMGLLFISVFGSLGYMNKFNYALTMSQKRKNIITGQAILSFIKATISILLIYALNVFERYICQNVFSEYPMDSDLSVIFTPKFMLLFIMAFTALEVCFGAIYTKFGTKYFWIVWMGMALLMQFPARIIDSVLESMKADDAHFMHKVVEFFVNCDKTVLFAIAYAILIIIISLPYAILKKQRVTI